jgi:hypothetical protein
MAVAKDLLGVASGSVVATIKSEESFGWDVATGCSLRITRWVYYILIYLVLYFDILYTLTHHYQLLV